MAHSPEQRSKQPLCGAKKRNGEKCRAFAGQGTDHRGVGRCKNHGGSTRTHKQAAIAVEAKQRLAKFGEPIDVQPLDALMSLLRMSAGHVHWLRLELDRLDDLGTHEAQVILRAYDEERDRLTRIAKTCMDAGVSEVIIRQEEATLAFVARVLDQFIGGLDLDDEQLSRAPELLRTALTTLEAPTPPAPSVIFGQMAA